jgi:hypothetical protein
MDPEAPIAAAKIALHWGTPLRRRDDLYGNDVNLASRMVDQAKGGQILVSEPLRAELSDVPPPPPMKKAGRATGKGLKEKPQLWSVEPQEDRGGFISALGDGVLATFLFDPVETDADTRPEADFWEGMRAAEAVFNGFGAEPVFAGRRTGPGQGAPGFCVLVSFPTLTSWEDFLTGAESRRLRDSALAVIRAEVVAAYASWPQLGTLFPPAGLDRDADD